MVENKQNLIVTLLIINTVLLAGLLLCKMCTFSKGYCPLSGKKGSGYDCLYSKKGSGYDAAVQEEVTPPQP